MNTIVGSELEAHLASIAADHGVNIKSSNDHKLRGTQEAIKSKWFLGGRKVVYSMACDVDEPVHTVRFRESALETSWGIPPPTLTVETTTQHGTKVNESRVDRSVGGGGRLDYGTLRSAFEQTSSEAGWTFAFEAGKRP